MKLSTLFLALPALLTACATQTSAIPPRANEVIQGGATKIELHLGADGKINKIEVYHTAAERVPEAVRKLAEEQLKGGKVKAYEYEVAGDGTETFEVEATMPDGSECEVSATPQGALLYRECHVAVDKAPDAVKKAALAAVSGEILEVEQKQGPGLDEFSVEIRAASGEVHKVRLNAAGQVLGRSRKVPAQVELPARLRRPWGQEVSRIGMPIPIRDSEIEILKIGSLFRSFQVEKSGSLLSCTDERRSTKLA